MQECIFCKLLQLKSTVLSTTSPPIFTVGAWLKIVFEERKKKKLLVLCNDVM